MGCGWWNPPTPYKEDCYWYREEQDMNAHIPYCTCKNQFPLNTCENCDDYHSRSKRTQGDRIRSMTDEELAKWIALHPCLPYCPAQTDECLQSSKHDSCTKRWLDWLRQEVADERT